MGSAAQVKAMKQVSGSMKLELAQYSEMAAFSQFSSDLDVATKKLLNRGARLTEMLKQPVYHPLSLEEEVVILFAGSNGFLDELELKDIKPFEDYSLNKMKQFNPSLMKEIREKKEISTELKDKLTEFFANTLKEYQDTLSNSDEKIA